MPAASPQSPAEAGSLYVHEQDVIIGEACVCHRAFVEVRTTCQSYLFPSIVWVPGIKLKSPRLEDKHCEPLLSHVPNPIFLTHDGISAPLEVLLSAWLPSSLPVVPSSPRQPVVKLWNRPKASLRGKGLSGLFCLLVVGGVWGRVSVAYSVSLP